MHDSDETLGTSASIAERAAPAVSPEPIIVDDNNLDEVLGDEGDKDIPLHNDIGDLGSQITVEDHLDMVTQNRLMLELLLENHAHWKAEEKHEWERMAAKQEQLAAARDQCAAERAELAKRTIIGPRPNLYKMVDPVQ